MNYNIKNLSLDDYLDLLRIFSHTNSQLNQEAFVTLFTGFKENGVFVEFGASDGKQWSNTYCLEHNLHWQGLLVEPNKNFYKELKSNRNCIIDTRCVYKESNQTLLFSENINDPELSGLKNYLPFSKDKELNSIYSINTISLLDLLNEYNFPRLIDYLSIDTEGSEFEILNSFDFSKYDFRIITVEHNYSPNREKIFQLLSTMGYVRVLIEVSKFDDWYVNSKFLKMDLVSQE